MYQILCDFEGANCRVLSVNEDGAHVEVELRDTIGDWFYWCFRVVGAAGLTLTFIFPSTCRVGYFGAAVSHDFENWHWQYDTKGHEGAQFTYTFAEGENAVYFAHDMLYRPSRFTRFAESCGLQIRTLCTSERGRPVPYIDTEKGDEVILLTARHHACEATGSYVLEGVLGSMLAAGVQNHYRIICVPFVDYDGVVDGDQGKNRGGHDHNRDYIEGEAARYASVREIRRFADTLRLRFAFDFHSPWHLSGRNDTVFIPIKHYDILDNITRFSRLWEEACRQTPAALPHDAGDDMLPDVEWNTFGAPCFGTYTGRAGAELAFTVETPYFLAGDRMFTPSAALALGEAFARAFEEYTEG